MGEDADVANGGNPGISARPLFGSGVGPLIAVLLGTISFALLFGWDGLFPLLTVPLIVGAFLGLMATSLTESAVIGGSAGLLGSVLASFFYRWDAFVWYMERTNPAAVGDLPEAVFPNYIGPLIRGNPVNGSHGGVVLVIAVGVVLTIAVSMATWWLVQRLPSRVDRRWLALAVLVPLGVCLASTIFVNGHWFVRDMNRVPQAETYSFDGGINLKTYYLMRGGTNYYDAIIKAAAGDMRINDVKNGKWGRDWGIVSPTHIREPGVFYLWVAVGYFGASGIVWASVLLAIGLWVVWYVVLYERLGQRALFVALALFPLFAVHLTWNMLHPDWWAALMLMYSSAFLVRKRYTVAAVFALVMVLFREVFAFYLVVVLAVGAVMWLRKKLALRDVAPFGIALLVFVGAYTAHYMIEAPYVGMPAKGGTLSGILSVAGRPLDLRFLGPTSYLMFPYGDALVPAFILIMLGAAGLFLVLRGSEFARFALPAYLLAFLAFMAIVGASSTYWGQDLSLLGVTGFAVLLAALDRLRVGRDDQRA